MMKKVPARHVPVLEAAALSYRPAGRFAWQFARGKLGGDPAFRALLERRLVRDGTLLDLGCGQGLLAAWLLAARDRFEAGSRDDDRPVPPHLAAITGIELLPVDVRRARRALGNRAAFVVGDIRTTAFPRADTVAILDVLHYIPIAEQDAVLRRVRAALNPSGVLLLRIGDAGAGFGFRYSNWVDRSVMLVKGQGWNPLYCRSLTDWKTALARLGFDVESQPMSEGTPFANVLLVART